MASTTNEQAVLKASKKNSLTTSQNESSNASASGSSGKHTRASNSTASDSVSFTSRRSARSTTSAASDGSREMERLIVLAKSGRSAMLDLAAGSFITIRDENLATLSLGSNLPLQITPNMLPASTNGRADNDNVSLDTFGSKADTADLARTRQVVILANFVASNACATLSATFRDSLASSDARSRSTETALDMIYARIDDLQTELDSGDDVIEFGRKWKESITTVAAGFCKAFSSTWRLTDADALVVKVFSSAAWLILDRTVTNFMLFPDTPMVQDFVIQQFKAAGAYFADMFNLFLRPEVPLASYHGDLRPMTTMNKYTVFAYISKGGYTDYLRSLFTPARFGGLDVVGATSKAVEVKLNNHTVKFMNRAAFVNIAGEEPGFVDIDGGFLGYNLTKSYHTSSRELRKTLLDLTVTKPEMRFPHIPLVRQRAGFVGSFVIIHTNKFYVDGKPVDGEYVNNVLLSAQAGGSTDELISVAVTSEPAHTSRRVARIEQLASVMRDFNLAARRQKVPPPRKAGERALPSELEIAFKLAKDLVNDGASALKNRQYIVSGAASIPQIAKKLGKSEDSVRDEYSEIVIRVLRVSVGSVATKKKPTAGLFLLVSIRPAVSIFLQGNEANRYKEISKPVNITVDAEFVSTVLRDGEITTVAKDYTLDMFADTDDSEIFSPHQLKRLAEVEYDAVHKFTSGEVILGSVNRQAAVYFVNEDRSDDEEGQHLMSVIGGVETSTIRMRAPRGDDPLLKGRFRFLEKGAVLGLRFSPISVERLETQIINYTVTEILEDCVVLSGGKLSLFAKVNYEVSVSDRSIAYMKEPNFSRTSPLSGMNVVAEDTLDDSLSRTLEMAQDGLKPLLVIRGPPGAGKTTFVRTMFQTLSSAKFTYVIQTNEGSKAMLDWCYAQKVRNVSFSTVDSFIASQKQGATGVLIVDECSMLSLHVWFTLLTEAFSCGYSGVIALGDDRQTGPNQLCEDPTAFATAFDFVQAVTKRAVPQLPITCRMDAVSGGFLGAHYPGIRAIRAATSLSRCGHAVISEVSKENINALFGRPMNYVQAGSKDVMRDNSVVVFVATRALASALSEVGIPASTIAKHQGCTVRNSVVLFGNSAFSRRTNYILTGLTRGELSNHLVHVGEPDEALTKLFPVHNLEVGSPWNPKPALSAWKALPSTRPTRVPTVVPSAGASCAESVAMSEVLTPASEVPVEDRALAAGNLTSTRCSPAESAFLRSLERETGETHHTEKEVLLSSAETKDRRSEPESPPSVEPVVDSSCSVVVETPATAAEAVTHLEVPRTPFDDLTETPEAYEKRIRADELRARTAALEAIARVKAKQSAVVSQPARPTIANTEPEPRPLVECAPTAEQRATFDQVENELIDLYAPPPPRRGRTPDSDSSSSSSGDSDSDIFPERIRPAPAPVRQVQPIVLDENLVIPHEGDYQGHLAPAAQYGNAGSFVLPSRNYAAYIDENGCLGRVLDLFGARVTRGQFSDASAFSLPARLGLSSQLISYRVASAMNSVLAAFGISATIRVREHRFRFDQTGDTLDLELTTHAQVVCGVHLRVFRGLHCPANWKPIAVSIAYPGDKRMVCVPEPGNPSGDYMPEIRCATTLPADAAPRQVTSAPQCLALLALEYGYDDISSFFHAHPSVSEVLREVCAGLLIPTTLQGDRIVLSSQYSELLAFAFVEDYPVDNAWEIVGKPCGHFVLPEAAIDFANLCATLVSVRRVLNLPLSMLTYTVGTPVFPSRWLHAFGLKACTNGVPHLLFHPDATMGLDGSVYSNGEVDVHFFRKTYARFFKTAVGKLIVYRDFGLVGGMASFGGHRVYSNSDECVFGSPHCGASAMRIPRLSYLDSDSYHNNVAVTQVPVLNVGHSTSANPFRFISDIRICQVSACAADEEYALSIPTTSWSGINTNSPLQHLFGSVLQGITRHTMDGVDVKQRIRHGIVIDKSSPRRFAPLASVLYRQAETTLNASSSLSTEHAAQYGFNRALTHSRAGLMNITVHHTFFSPVVTRYIVERNFMDAVDEWNSDPIARSLTPIVVGNSPLCEAEVPRARSAANTQNPLYDFVTSSTSRLLYSTARFLILLLCVVGVVAMNVFLVMGAGSVEPRSAFENAVLIRAITIRPPVETGHEEHGSSKFLLVPALIALLKCILSLLLWSLAGRTNGPRVASPLTRLVGITVGMLGSWVRGNYDTAIAINLCYVLVRFALGRRTPSNLQAMLFVHMVQYFASSDDVVLGVVVCTVAATVFVLFSLVFSEPSPVLTDTHTMAREDTVGALPFTSSHSVVGMIRSLWCSPVVWVGSPLQSHYIPGSYSTLAFDAIGNPYIVRVDSSSRLTLSDGTHAQPAGTSHLMALCARKQGLPPGIYIGDTGKSGWIRLPAKEAVCTALGVEFSEGIPEWSVDATLNVVEGFFVMDGVTSPTMFPMPIARTVGVGGGSGSELAVALFNTELEDRIPYADIGRLRIGPDFSDRDVSFPPGTILKGPTWATGTGDSARLAILLATCGVRGVIVGAVDDEGSTKPLIAKLRFVEHALVPVPPASPFHRHAVVRVNLTADGAEVEFSLVRLQFATSGLKHMGLESDLLEVITREFEILEIEHAKESGMYVTTASWRGPDKAIRIVTSMGEDKITCLFNLRDSLARESESLSCTDEQDCRNWKQECQRRGVDPPERFTRSGADHVPVHTCSLNWMGISVSHSSSNKAQASAGAWKKLFPEIDGIRCSDGLVSIPASLAMLPFVRSTTRSKESVLSTFAEIESLLTYKLSVDFEYITEPSSMSRDTFLREGGLVVEQVLREDFSSAAHIDPRLFHGPRTDTETCVEGKGFFAQALPGYCHDAAKNNRLLENRDEGSGPVLIGRRTKTETVNEFMYGCQDGCSESAVCASVVCGPLCGDGEDMFLPCANAGCKANIAFAAQLVHEQEQNKPPRTDPDLEPMREHLACMADRFGKLDERTLTINEVLSITTPYTARKCSKIRDIEPNLVDDKHYYHSQPTTDLKSQHFSTNSAGFVKNENANGCARASPDGSVGYLGQKFKQLKAKVRSVQAFGLVQILLMPFWIAFAVVSMFFHCRSDSPLFIAVGATTNMISQWYSRARSLGFDFASSFDGAAMDSKNGWDFRKLLWAAWFAFFYTVSPFLGWLNAVFEKRSRGDFVVYGPVGIKFKVNKLFSGEGSTTKDNVDAQTAILVAFAKKMPRILREFANVFGWAPTLRTYSDFGYTLTNFDHWPCVFVAAVMGDDLLVLWAPEIAAMSEQERKWWHDRLAAHYLDYGFVFEGSCGHADTHSSFLSSYFIRDAHDPTKYHLVGHIGRMLSKLFCMSDLPSHYKDGVPCDYVFSRLHAKIASLGQSFAHVRPLKKALSRWGDQAAAAANACGGLQLVPVESRRLLEVRDSDEVDLSHLQMLYPEVDVASVLDGLLEVDIAERFYDPGVFRLATSDRSR